MSAFAACGLPLQDSCTTAEKHKLIRSIRRHEWIIDGNLGPEIILFRAGRPRCRYLHSLRDMREVPDYVCAFSSA